MDCAHTVPRAGYDSVTLKQGVIALVDRFVEENQEGYTSRSEVIAAAVREFVNRRREQPEAPERSRYVKDPRTLERR